MSADLGKLIQQYREKAEMTQGDLGKVMGVSQQTIAKWESGKSKPRVKAMGRLVRELKIDASSRHVEIFSGADGLSSEEYDAAPLRHLGSTGPADRGTARDIPEDFPTSAMFRHAVNTLALKRLLAPVIDAIEPTSKWNNIVQSQWGPVRLDYMNDELWANFLHCPTTFLFAANLRGPIYKHLWRYATINGGVLDTAHYQLLILTVPEDQALDFAPGETPEFSPPASNTRMLKRLTAEAMSLGIYVVLARTPQEVISILTDPSRLGAYKQIL